MLIALATKNTPQIVFSDTWAKCNQRYRPFHVPLWGRACSASTSSTLEKLISCTIETAMLPCVLGGQTVDDLDQGKRRSSFLSDVKSAHESCSNGQDVEFTSARRLALCRAHCSIFS